MMIIITMMMMMMTMMTMARMTPEGWSRLAGRTTDSDGRAAGFVSWQEFGPGVYKMNFAVEDYFSRQNKETFYPYVEVVFDIKDPTAHYHIPLLLNPYGYTTYRGS